MNKFKKSLVAVAGVAAVVAVALFCSPVAQAGGNYYSGPTSVFQSSTVAGTNSYLSYTQGTNSPSIGSAVPVAVSMPNQLAVSTGTNLGYRIDMTGYTMLGVQFTGANIGNGSNTVAMVFGANNDGSTNVGTLLTWTVGVTNTAAGFSTLVTNLGPNNGYMGGEHYFYLVSVTTGAGFGASPVGLTNFGLTFSPK